METREFQAEAAQVLDLMIHSVYSNKDIFLRELISNSSDALDKLRFEALTNKELEPQTKDLHILLEADAEARTLTVHDNGIGMSREEVIQFIGTIAKSGTKEFVNLLKEAKKSTDLPPELIGQFGVGFYSSFIVADKVTLVSRKAGEEGATRWESTGDGKYTLDDAERENCGTSVTLHLKPADEDDAMQDYTKEWPIREIVKKYSDFVAYPIRMNVEKTEYPKDADGKIKEGAEPIKTVELETLNSMKAIWLRDPKEVKDEEHHEFYRHISHDWNEPLHQYTLKAEGTFEFRALLYLPSKAPFDLFYRDAQRGVQLYIKRIFIMSDCKELIPEYLRFVRGVVDSEDLSLNVSREILQQDRHIRVIRKRLIAKTFETLHELRENEPEKWAGFWKEFGRVLKEGLFADPENRDKLFELVEFPSTHDPVKTTTLADYVSRMKEGQTAIYYMTGESRGQIENSPHLEAFKAKGFEVLLLSDNVDEVWTQTFLQYTAKAEGEDQKDKTYSFKSIGKGEVELGGAEEKKKSEEERKEKETQYKDLLAAMKQALDERVKEVRLSSRLTDSPVCLVSDEADLTPQLEQMLREAGQDVPKSKRILELNPGHPILERLKARHALKPDDPSIAEYAELLYGQACLAEGRQPDDPASFSKKIAELMVKAMG
ncbi:molecular chaperone HtpG [Candidatus Sumerlaeota bacterium]|nr:molecular chaperone HtpG [Candidatus Sumerlaeota bacterium]